jgi:hypothetical protein
MKKLLILNYRALPLAAHYEFFTEVNLRITEAGEDLQVAVAALMPEYHSRLAAEEAVLRWTRKSELTKQIAEADDEIDRIMVGINGIVQTGRHSPMSAIKASGEKVYHKLQEYGHITRKPYTEQTGDLRALLKDFAGDYAQDVANLGMAMWVQYLQAAFDTFMNLLTQRDDEQVEKPDYTAEEARKAMEGAWRPVVDAINANAITSASGEFALFIDHLNPEIERVNAAFHRALKDLSEGDHTVVEPIPTQIYTGEPITVVPKVHYREEGKETKKLWLGKDFDVTYKNNKNVGMAEVIIHGKGEYKGQVTVTFNIAR